MKTVVNNIITYTITLIVIICVSSIINYAHAATKIDEITTKTGLKALLSRETSVPIISIQIKFTNAGSAYDDEHKAGLAEMASRLMLEGAGGLSDAEFQAELDKKAIKMSFGTDADNLSISMITLSEHKEKAFELLSLAITQPNLEPEAIERIRSSMLAELQIAKQNPNYIAAKSFAEEAFKNHPYSRTAYGSEKTLKSITKADIRKYINTKVTKGNIVIAAAGDISPAELRNLMEKTFSKLPEINHTKELKDKKIQVGTEKWVSKDIPQTIVYFGLNGVSRDDKRFYAAYVMNYIIGGSGLTSRLSKIMRQKHGLSYAISTNLAIYNHAYIMKGAFATRSNEAPKALTLLKEEMDNISKNGFTAEELKAAKEYITGSFPLRLTSNSSVVQYLMAIQTEDLGLDYLEKRNSYIEAVTLEQINQLAKELISSDKMLIVAVGKEIE